MLTKTALKQPLFYFHVHNGKGAHADGEDYEIVIVCEEHRAAVEDAEFITETNDEDERCDKCAAKVKGEHRGEIQTGD